MSLHCGNETLWLVYITIGNLDAKTRRSQTWPSNLLLSSIPIVYKRAKDMKNKDKNLKVKVYHLALKTMFEYIILVFSLFIFILLTNLAFIEYYNKGIEMLCVGDFKWCYYPVIARVIINYEEQVFITGIKFHKQYFKC